MAFTDASLRSNGMLVNMKGRLGEKSRPKGLRSLPTRFGVACWMPNRVTDVRADLLRA